VARPRTEKLDRLEATAGTSSSIDIGLRDHIGAGAYQIDELVPRSLPSLSSFSVRGRATSISSTLGAEELVLFASAPMAPTRAGGSV